MVTRKLLSYKNILFLATAFATISVLIWAVLLYINERKLTAISAAGFEAGRIMDDSILTSTGTMSVQQIQNFLNLKLTHCDTWGEKPSEYGGGTRAEYAASRGVSTPFTCLKSYSENGKSSAQIIHDAAQEFQINPQTLIALLQKEQGLVTDEWPFPIQYKTATGYGCPDTAPCDSEYYGLTNQLRWAAKMFRAISNGSPTWYTPYVLGNNNIQWNPASSCGGSTVNIQNRTTQALYNYTPYRPNQAALNAGFGTGDSCSSYGNRNFYLYFISWFGTTKVLDLPGCEAATNTARTCVWRLYNPANGQQNLTGINSERENLVVKEAHQYQSIAFYGNVKSLPGNIPVYRLIKPSGGSFLTASKEEYDALVVAGYTGKGINFYADPGHSNSGYPVYRLYYGAQNKHFWTSSQKERADLIASGYVDEGIAFASISTIRQERAAQTGQQLVYRFGDMPGNSHFWTSDLYERDAMIRAGYRYEGVAYRSLLAKTGTPVYRLYSPTMKKHLYTRDANEKNVLSNTSSWIYEGISSYMSDTVTERPVYRLYSHITKNHLLTTDANERNELVRVGTFVDEGIAWYQP